MKFLLRFDDITPNMAWSKFKKFEELSNEIGVPFLIGVVPNCLDSKLNVEPEIENFWGKIKLLKEKGWSIAQHGYTHQYVTEDAGILNIKNNSEFAGLDFMTQREKLYAGKEIMLTHKVWEPIFMAPSHSFDKNTLNALESLEFKYLTDGYGLYPLKFGKLIAVPQLFSSPLNFGFGIYTICLHVNNLSETQIEEIVNFTKKNRDKFISFEEALRQRNKIPISNIVINKILKFTLVFMRKIRKLIAKLVGK